MKHLKKDVIRLAATYLTIIMVMSIGFSSVLYIVASHEFGRRPPRSDGPFLDIDQNGVKSYFDQREQEANTTVILNLVIINLVTCMIGAVISYLLAEKTLRPIEEVLSAQAQFVSDASHELRTPLTALRTANEVALRNKRLTVVAARQTIQENVDDIARLQHLADSLLGLLRDDDKHLMKDVVDLQQVTSRAMNMVVQQAVDKHIQVEDLTQPLLAQGNEQRLVQVMTILLDNAIKYSPDHTTIRITTTKRAKSVYLHVQDQGIGMDEATAKAAFTRFYRADNSRSQTVGYGLGLAIAHKIITAHGGSLSITSALGEGSTFTVRLPAARK